MPGFASRDAIAQARSAGQFQDWQIYKAAVTAQAAGAWVSYFAAAGTPGAGTDPGAAWATCTDLAGTMTFTAPGGTYRRYLTGFQQVGSLAGTLMLYDRIGHYNIPAAALTVAGAKTITATLPARYSSGYDTGDLAQIQAWIEVTTATATTAATLNLSSYTNESGTAGRAGATIVLPAAATPVRYMAPLPLQAGDKGVTAINTVTVATPPTAGAVNIVLLRPIAFIPLALANVGTIADRPVNLKRVYDGSSLCLAMQCDSTTGRTIQGSFEFSYA